MSSRFAWVDFAETDRQKMLNIIHLFSDHETRDELGLGTIRDAFAEYFFPGTSTIQTRARYMLFIPWIYKAVERRDFPSAELTAQARKMEIDLIYALFRGQELEGVIGREAKDKLQRLPSNIYWVGLGGWGIRLFLGTQPQYHRFLPTFNKLRRTKPQYKENEIGEYARENWHMGLPKAPKDYLTQTNFVLTYEEAKYLSEMIAFHHRESLLAKLIMTDNVPDVRFVWFHPVIASVSPMLQSAVQLARNFSESMHGAVLLYNLMLAEKRQNQEWVEKYQHRIEQWMQLIKARWTELYDWYSKLPEFWQAAPLLSTNIPHPTRIFVEAWLAIIFTTRDILSSLNNSDTQSLIRQREFRLKGKRARLVSPRALEIWGGVSGERQLDYRWSNAAVIINDITRGLSKVTKDAES